MCMSTLLYNKIKNFGVDNRIFCRHHEKNENILVSTSEISGDTKIQNIDTATQEINFRDLDESDKC